MSELLGANTDVLERNAESLSTDARRVQDIRTLAQRAVAELQASWDGFDLTHLSQRWEQQTSLLLAGASASLDTCASQLRAQCAAQRVASGSDGASSNTVMPTAMVPTPAPPGTGASPTDNATWWRSLSSQQQQQVISQHPDWIGNRDGVSFAARDQANRALLIVDHDRLVAERHRLEVLMAGAWSGDLAMTESAELDQVRDKLASLAAITATLAKPGERQLLMLDLSSERAEAAIARGDVDTADNVAVFVPGMTSNVTDSMEEYDEQMTRLQARTLAESKNAHTNESAATVTWIGYQAPAAGLELISANSVVLDLAAKKGAANLVPLLRGIGAARERDAHLTLLGHSYGSTTAGLALRQNTGVDDAVFFGSPGLGTSNVSELKLAAGPGDPEHLSPAHDNPGPNNPGHISYIEAKWDPVGDVGRFGIDPSYLAGVDHVSASGSTIVDPVTGQVRHLQESLLHEHYLDENSTSQYNMSVIAAGLPGREVYDRGEGLGDVTRIAANMIPSRVFPPFSSIPLSGLSIPLPGFPSISLPGLPQ